jgi:prophage regulatory protein
MHNHLFHAVNAMPQATSSTPAPAFYRLRDVMRITALSRSTVYRRVAEGRFPAPVHLGGKVSAWAWSTLQVWINDPEGYRTKRPQRAL